MTSPTDPARVNDGAAVPAAVMQDALTAAPLRYDDGASQVFTADGTTTYLEPAGATRGEWEVLGDGRFTSFWPPRFRAGYDVAWVVEAGRVVGLTFRDGAGRTFSGRYQAQAAQEPT